MSISIAFQEPALNSYVQCSVLLPKRKLERFPLEFMLILGQLAETFGGYTIGGEALGAWIDSSSGLQHIDTHLVIFIAIRNNQACLGVLTTLLGKAAQQLREYCVFVSVGGEKTFFVWASPEEQQPVGAANGGSCSEAA